MNPPPSSSRAPAPDGVLLVDKPAGCTSHDVVAKIRRVDRKARIGHTGTLDPLATGLLVVCIGAATRLQQFLTGLDKSYGGEIRLGFATTTYDSEGERSEPSGDPIGLDPTRIDAAVKAFVGESDQLSPPYSARKVEGKRFYEIARKGGEVPAIAKRILIRRFVTGPLSDGRLPFELDCSTGTYVRTVAHELGIALGVGGHISALRRATVGPFRLADALPLEDWMSLPEEERWKGKWFLPLSSIPLPCPRVRLDERGKSVILAGQAVVIRGEGSFAEGERIALEDPSGELLAIGDCSAGESWFSVQPRIVLGK
jgi:tRNA pseudouridine55 synthase